MTDSQRLDKIIEQLNVIRIVVSAVGGIVVAWFVVWALSG